MAVTAECLMLDYFMTSLTSFVSNSNFKFNVVEYRVQMLEKKHITVPIFMNLTVLKR